MTTMSLSDSIAEAGASKPEPAAEDGRWTICGAIAFTTAVMAAPMIAALVGIQAVTSLYFGGSFFDWLASSRLSATHQQQLAVGAQLLAELAQLGMIWWLAGRYHKDRLAALGLHATNLRIRGWLGAAMLVLVVKAVVTAVVFGNGGGDPRDELSDIIAMARQPLVWVALLGTVMLAGATEELAFRGVLSRTLEATRLGFWGGAALASAAFAGVHLQYGLGGQCVVFMLGMTLAWIRRWSGSIWPCIACHALNNAVAIAAMRIMM